MRIKKVSIVGMGALGILFGSRIYRSLGKSFVNFVMDSERYKKYAGQEVFCNGERYDFEIVSEKEATAADLVIVAVKYTGLKEACERMKNLVGPDTIIISVLNGITSEQIIGDRYGMDKIIYTVAQGMDAMKFGNKLSYTREGELRIGMTKEADRTRFESLVEFFDVARIPYVVEEDILFRMWGKFMLNVGINQTCMVYGVPYKGALEPGEANRTLIAAMREVIAIANAEGVGLGEKDLNGYVQLIRTLSPDGTPSMGQDRINKKPSEVDMFAGAVMEIARKHSLLVPTNEFLYHQAKELEKQY